MKKRMVYVPGEPIDGVKTLISDAAGNAVIAVPHAGVVVAVFVLRGESATARLMSEQQGEKFAYELSQAHTAASDDIKIANMEKDFDEGN